MLLCTMKHADGATMTHMLRLTSADLDMGGWLVVGAERRRNTKKKK